MAEVLKFELVHRRKWMSEDAFYDDFTLATLVPGAIIVNMACIQGWRYGRFFGALSAVVGTVLPPFAIILVVAIYAVSFFEYPLIQGFLQGGALAVGALLVYTISIFAHRKIRSWRGGLLFAGATLVLMGTAIHPLVVLFTLAGLFLVPLGRTGVHGDSP